MSAVLARTPDVVSTGLPFGAVRWGTHLCHFFRSAQDLEDVIAPFLAAGLANGEHCVWVLDAALTAERARELLAKHADLAAARSDQLAIVDADDIGWLEREQHALAAGFRGLRIACVAPSTDWNALAAHEGRMHRALHGRRVTALCSYRLDACGPHEIIDVLRHHKSALLRRDGVWEHIGSATAALAIVSASAAAAVKKAHTVEFYESDDYPASSTARRLADALAKGHAALALCVRDHLGEVLAGINRRLDPADALASGRLLLLEADTVFAEAIAAADFEAAMEAKLGTPLRELVAKFGRVRVYGELVDVCCRRRRHDLAVALERWWNRQIAELPIELHCGYDVTSFADAESIADFRHVCDEHGYVFARKQIGATDPDRLAAELQQVSSVLESEIARRAAAESEALVSRAHLVELQRITSALGEAATFAAIGSVVTEDVAPAVGASGVAIAIDAQLIAQRGITTPDDTAALGAALEHAPAQWTTREQLGSELAWFDGALVAVLPLMIVNDRIGTLVLGFDRQQMGVGQRALVDDLVAQIALAVDRARIYEHAMQERVRAERASAAKDQLIAMLGHELRNPLAPILSATQVMRLRSPDQLAEERATIERCAKHMIRLVDDLLDVSQVVRGEITLAREPVDVGELVQQAVDGARSVIDTHAVTIDVTPSLVVDVDRERMRQVIANLVINAVKHAPADPVEITARAHGEDVEIRVRDRGSGIDPELLPHVFELFVQGRQDSDRARGGLGVGLAIARSIVELHGGTITAASAGRGTGATFTICVPRWHVERTTEQIMVPAVPGGRRVLVVDDNEDAAWLLAEALRLLGHDVRVAHEGESGLELAQTWIPEVALLDIGLPGMDGFELCQALAKLPQRPYAIAVSGYGQPKDRQMAREAGFRAHFVKPVDLRDVQAAIEALSDN